MTTLKKFVEISQAAFGGALCGLVIGVYGGMIFGLLAWPFSNLGPLAGMVIGLPLGVCLGFLYGLMKGLRSGLVSQEM